MQLTELFELNNIVQLPDSGKSHIFWYLKHFETFRLIGLTHSLASAISEKVMVILMWMRW